MPVALAAFGGERDADLAALLGAAKVEDAGAHRVGAFLGRERHAAEAGSASASAATMRSAARASPRASEPPEVAVLSGLGRNERGSP